MPDRCFDPQVALLAWYARHRRDLPWRRNPDPYRVVVSEVMLQQTQVERVVPFFEAFTQRFASFGALASAPRSEVIRAWGGLGYNRRAVYLHRLAEIVVSRYGGELPSDRAALLSLPGIGPYTAGAILSIAFGHDEPALDTNARRVLARYAFEQPPRSDATTFVPRRDSGRGSTFLLMETLARRLLPPGRAGEWNQALMDLGSTVCLRRRPQCPICPLRAGCAAAHGLAASTPAASTRSGQPFVGSMRYYRGQLLGQLRALGADAAVPLHYLAQRLSAHGVGEPPMGWRMVGEGLARDGLARLIDTAHGVQVGLPDGTDGIRSW